MDSPITLYLQVKEKNIKENVNSLNITEYPINVTLNHKIDDIKNSIWRKSHDYILKPIFLNIAHNDHILSDNEKICDIFNIDYIPEKESSIYKSLDLIIDYTLFGNRAIPMCEPNIELFDIVIESKIGRKENILSYRESLNCSLKIIKDYYIEYASKHHEDVITRNDVKVQLKIEEESLQFDEDDQNLSDILKLDVVPLKTVIFVASLKTVSNQEMFRSRQYKRFHIKIESNVPSLQEGANLFEVNRQTKLHEFKHQLIERIDYLSVARTFYDQIELYYQTQLLPNTNEVNKMSLFELLLLNDSILQENNGIITMHLDISNRYTGGRVLSQQFWRDLMSDDRFEFLPNSNNDLPSNNDLDSNNNNNSNSNNETPTTNNDSSNFNEGNSNFPSRIPHVNFYNNNRAENNRNNTQILQENMVSVTPTRLFLRDGVEWNLTGESYELLSLNETSTTNVSGPRSLLLNQTDLSPTHYEIKADIDGETKKATFNTSQCIIVDNGTHRPYILLNQTGTALLDAKFRRNNGNTTLQQSYVELYDPQNNQDSNNNNEVNEEDPGQQLDIRQAEINRIIEILRTNLFRGLNILIRSSFIIYILGLHRPFIVFWKQIMIVFSIILVVSVFIFAGEHIAHAIVQILLRGNERPVDFNQRLLLNTAQLFRFVNRNTNNAFSTTRKKLIVYSVNRTRDYQFFIQRRTNLYYLFNNLSNIPKDLVLILLTLIPSFHPHIYQELETWRSNEISDLREEVNKIYQLVLGGISVYNIKNDDPFVIPHSERFNELETKFNSEDQSNWDTQYKDMIEFYKLLKVVKSKLK